MQVNTAHCLFEQSGTFKNQFKKLGMRAYDYDILNDFNETDYQIDLFQEIESAYRGGQSIFDNIGEDDLIIAFFPCTRFETKCAMHMKCHAYAELKWDDEKKVAYSMKMNDEVASMYRYLCEMFLIVLQRGLRMIVENPYHHDSYLTRYFPIEPRLIDKDRTKNGDYFKKPTQYFFINCDPENNLVFEPLEYVEQERIIYVNRNRSVERSKIHPQYANRFIRQYILDGE